MSPKSNADGAGSADRVAAGLVAFAGKARGQKNGLGKSTLRLAHPDLVGAFRHALPLGLELRLHYRQFDCSLPSGRAPVYETLTLRIG